MFAWLVADPVREVGPFVIPVVLFAVGVTGYALLWLFYRWRDGERTDRADGPDG